MPTYISDNGWSEPYKILAAGLAQYGQNRQRRKDREYLEGRDAKQDERQAIQDALMQRQIEQQMAGQQFDLGQKQKKANADDALLNLDFSQFQAEPPPMPPVGPPTLSQSMGAARADMSKPWAQQDPAFRAALTRDLVAKGVAAPQVAAYFDQNVAAQTGRPVLPQAPEGMRLGGLDVGGAQFEPEPPPLPPGAVPASMKVGNTTYDFPDAQSGPAHIQPVVGPDGRPMPGLYTGPDGKAHPLPRNAAPTEAQSNARIYAERMKFNEDALKGIKYDPTSKFRLPESLPLDGDFFDPVLRLARSGEGNQYIDTKRNWIAAVLRKESGAAISESEYAHADRQYFPQLGDGPEQIAQKQRLRDKVRQEMETIGNPPQVQLPGFDGQAIEPPPGAPPAPTGVSPNNGAPVTISSKQEFEALQPGTKFIWAPTGQPGTKR